MNYSRKHRNNNMTQAITLFSECGVLGNGNKLHQHMVWNKTDRTFAFCWHYTMPLPPPCLATPHACSQFSSLALHHKITALLPTNYLKTITKTDKHQSRRTLMTPPLTFHYCLIEIGYLEQSELQDWHVSTNRQKERETEVATFWFFWNILRLTPQWKSELTK